MRTHHISNDRAWLALHLSAGDIPRDQRHNVAQEITQRNLERDTSNPEYLPPINPYFDRVVDFDPFPVLNTARTTTERSELYPLMPVVVAGETYMVKWWISRSLRLRRERRAETDDTFLRRCRILARQVMSDERLRVVEPVEEGDYVDEEDFDPFPILNATRTTTGASNRFPLMRIVVSGKVYMAKRWIAILFRQGRERDALSDESFLWTCQCFARRIARGAKLVATEPVDDENDGYSWNPITRSIALPESAFDSTARASLSGIITCTNAMLSNLPLRSAIGSVEFMFRGARVRIINEHFVLAEEGCHGGSEN